MAAWPRNVYLSAAAARNVPQDVAEAAIAQAEVLRASGTAVVLTLRHLSERSGVPYNVLRAIVARTYRDPYRVFPLRKRSGGYRRIHVPAPLLLRVQRWIHRHVLAIQSAGPDCYSYVRGRSPLDAAQLHLGCKWLIKIDIRQFFESISERQVYYWFSGRGYQPLIAFELARLCTTWETPLRRRRKRWMNNSGRHDAIKFYASNTVGFLPQGAATSPLLSNFVGTALDAKVGPLASAVGLVYTRYADDLYFSTAAKTFTRAIAQRFIRDVEVAMRQCGFRSNSAKTTISPPGARKIVLGLLVDGERVRLSRSFRLGLEQHIYGVLKFGPGAHAISRSFQSISGLRAFLEGKLAFAAQVDPVWADKCTRVLAAVSWPL